VLSVTSRNYACAQHATQATALGYEVFEGEKKLRTRVRYYERRQAAKNAPGAKS